VNGHDAGPMGNDDAHLAPHGVYPCAGDDAWIAIACRSDEEWRALCGALGRSDLAADSRFATAAGRLAHRRELDEALSAWTRGLPPREAEQRLQEAGVAAHGVQNGRECATDPQLLHRGHFVEVPHGTLGKVVVEGPRARLSRTPARVTKGAPSLGEHNHDVLASILGYTEDRITALAAAGVLG
jgi:crotonobetainyl-CoA:carnitine CoA-transferase CaiB-like acyl-CoA transferase